MQKRKNISIGGLLLALTAAGAFIYYKASQCSSCPMRKNTVVLWNNTGKYLTVEMRFRHLKPQYLEVAPGVRACVPLVSDRTFQSWDALRYLAVGYGTKKFKFTKLEVLNTAEKSDTGRSTRYLMIAHLTVNEDVWDRVSKNYAAKDKSLNEDYRYIILSNYGKKDSPWGSKAHIQALQAKKMAP